jgi:hypothetical protein
MRLPRVRLSVRQMMVGVVCLSVILGAGVVSVRWLLNPHVTGVT